MCDYNKNHVTYRNPIIAQPNVTSKGIVIKDYSTAQYLPCCKGGITSSPISSSNCRRNLNTTQLAMSVAPNMLDVKHEIIMFEDLKNVEDSIKKQVKAKHPKELSMTTEISFVEGWVESSNDITVEFEAPVTEKEDFSEMLALDAVVDDEKLAEREVPEEITEEFEASVTEKEDFSELLALDVVVDDEKQAEREVPEEIEAPVAEEEDYRELLPWNAVVDTEIQVVREVPEEITVEFEAPVAEEVDYRELLPWNAAFVEANIEIQAEAPEKITVEFEAPVAEEEDFCEMLALDAVVDDEKQAEREVPEEIAMKIEANKETPETKAGRDVPIADLKKHHNSEQNRRRCSEDGLYGRGLYHFQKWWYRNGVDVKVNGELLSGIPIFTEHNTMRVVNQKYSYFIPLEKIDYIRTTDGLNQTKREYES